MGAFVQLRAEHIRVCSHLQAVKPFVLWWRHGARRLVLVDLDDLVLRVGVEERGNADLGDEIAGDLAAVERVLARDDQLSGWRVRLEPARAHNGVVDARGAQVPDKRIGRWQGGVCEKALGISCRMAMAEDVHRSKARCHARGLSYFSATIFSSRTPPKALVI